MNGKPEVWTGHPIFARCYALLSPLTEGMRAAVLRRELLGGLFGVVVEIGAGGGLNFHHYPETVSSVIAVEPERHLRRVAERAARRARVSVTIVEATAERLPLCDGSADAAVAALVLCSVKNPSGSLAELYRVVRPGGELRFYEHVRGGRLGGAVQDTIDPLWTLCTGGCHLNRDTEAEIRKAGFLVERKRQVPTRALSAPVPGPKLVLGLARRP